MNDVDLSTVEGSYVALLDARDRPRGVAADLVRALKTKTQNSGKQSHEVEMAQADAWLAICALSKSLDTDYETTSEVWSRAISRTEEWRNLLDWTLLTGCASAGLLMQRPFTRWRLRTFADLNLRVVDVR
jgi:hypothetical protein